MYTTRQTSLKINNAFCLHSVSVEIIGGASIHSFVCGGIYDGSVLLLREKNSKGPIQAKSFGSLCCVAIIYTAVFEPWLLILLCLSLIKATSNENTI